MNCKVPGRMGSLSPLSAPSFLQWFRGWSQVTGGELHPPCIHRLNPHCSCRLVIPWVSQPRPHLAQQCLRPAPQQGVTREKVPGESEREQRMRPKMEGWPGNGLMGLSRGLLGSSPLGTF